MSSIEKNNNDSFHQGTTEGPASTASRKDRILTFLRKVFVPTQEELARDLTAVGHGMAFYPPGVYYGS